MPSMGFLFSFNQPCSGVAQTVWEWGVSPLSLTHTKQQRRRREWLIKNAFSKFAVCRCEQIKARKQRKEWNLRHQQTEHCSLWSFLKFPQELVSSGCGASELCLESASWWPHEPRQPSLRQGHARCPLQLTATERTVSAAHRRPPWPRPSNILGEGFNLFTHKSKTRLHESRLTCKYFTGRRRPSTSTRSSSVSTASVWISWWSWLDSAVPQPSHGWASPRALIFEMQI